MIYVLYITLIKNVESLPVSGPADSTHITEQYTPEMGCFSLSVISSVPDLNATYVVSRSPSPQPRSPSPPPHSANLTASFDVTRQPNTEPTEIQEK